MRMHMDLAKAEHHLSNYLQYMIKTTTVLANIGSKHTIHLRIIDTKWTTLIYNTERSNMLVLIASSTLHPSTLNTLSRFLTIASISEPTITAPTFKGEVMRTVYRICVYLNPNFRSHQSSACKISFLRVRWALVWLNRLIRLKISEVSLTLWAR